MCVILDAYNNNAGIHIVKTRITHNDGIKVQRRRKQTNKKKGTKRCLAWQLDEERGATRYKSITFLTHLLFRYHNHGGYLETNFEWEGSEHSVKLKIFFSKVSCKHRQTWFPKNRENSFSEFSIFQARVLLTLV